MLANMRSGDHGGGTVMISLPKRCSEMQNLVEVARTTENFALNTRGAQKLRRFSNPDLASLKCYTFLCPTPKQAAAPWGWRKGTDNIPVYDCQSCSNP